MGGDDPLDRILIYGCGKMGSALLGGWLDSGIDPNRIQVVEPFPSDWLRSVAKDLGVELNPSEPLNPSICVIAVKPQTIGQVLATLGELVQRNTLILSIAAGVRIARLEAAFSDGTPVVRAMPNTPAAIGLGVSAIVGNRSVEERHLRAATLLLDAVGKTVRIDSEDEMDVVTAVSGSGPAYVFLLIEALRDAAKRRGLTAEVSHELAISTVFGAASLARESDRAPDELRHDVTSPNGTTAAALEVLLAPDTGLPTLLDNAVDAAETRSRELANE